MKKHFLFSSFILAFILIQIKSFKTFAQVKQIEDPALTHSNYVSVDAGMNYVSPNYTYKSAIINGYAYNLGNNIAGAYLPISSIEVGHVFKLGTKDIYIFKLNSGISIASYSLNMIDYKNAAQSISETFLQIPLAISTHIPLTIYQPQAHYHALELKFGGYYGINITREIQTDIIPESSKSADFPLPAHEYGKFSLFAEAGVSFTAPNGHSHEIGIRASHDMGPYLHFNNSPELPFLYNSVGIFYRWTFYCF
jgi:hypothetical protein